ncbi:hypothetical protein LTR53_017850, partial [Teratosphaeriaceae sp. CCFEE 6253]
MHFLILFALVKALDCVAADVDPHVPLKRIRDSYNQTSSAGASTSEDSTTYITVDVTSTITYTTASITGTEGLPTVVGNATALASASSCNAAKQLWVANSGRVFVSNTTFTTSTLNVSVHILRSQWTQTSLFHSGIYTLCDGYPRINGSTSITGIDTTSASTRTDVFPTVTGVYRNASAPTCTIPSAECAALEAEYTTASIAYSRWAASEYSTATLTPTMPRSPICGPATWTIHPPMTLIPPACAVNTASLQLLYWPVATASGGNVCGNMSTLTATPTIPGQANTVVYMNTTLTSPTVYMEFKNVFAIGTDYVAESSFQQTLLALPATAVSSRCGLLGGGFGPPLSMNYADLDEPVPASAYRCQPKCFTNDDLPQSWTVPHYNYTRYATENRCSTLWADDYRPALSVPSEFATVFPSAGFINSDLPSLACTFILDVNGENIFFDPPKALQQVQDADAPVVPTAGGGSGAATTSPSAIPVVVPGTAAQTPTSTPTAAPLAATPDPPDTPETPSTEDPSAPATSPTTPDAPAPATTVPAADPATTAAAPPGTPAAPA